MFRLNDVVSSDSSADSDDSGDNDDVIDEGAQSVKSAKASLQESCQTSLFNQCQSQTLSQVHSIATTRSKRSIAWCGVDDDAPLPSATLSSGSLRVERPKSPKRPSLDLYSGVSLTEFLRGDRMQLYCQSYQFLAIYPDGKVKGTGDPQDPHTRLEMIPTGFPGHVVIKGLLTNLYVSMNNKGRLRAQGNRDAEVSVFIEGTIGFYMYYLSRHYAHNGWYLGIKKSGKFKNGKKTKLNQKAVRWLKLYPK